MPLRDSRIFLNLQFDKELRRDRNTQTAEPSESDAGADPLQLQLELCWCQIVGGLFIEIKIYFIDQTPFNGRLAELYLYFFYMDGIIFIF